MSKKFLLILLSAGILSACTGLKGKWNNFRAYYNTYYNAREHYRDGLKAIHEQPVTINPEEPVLPHRVPPLAGEEAFEQAIDKSAMVLRRHSKSKWTDDALLLMGKSYYYLQEFSAAADRFEQVQEADSERQLKQEAMVWKGKSLLNIKDYAGGINYLKPILQRYSIQRELALEGELRLLMGEYTAMLEDWEESAGYLSGAVNSIKDRTLLGRTFFLYGQVLERLGRLGEALFAYKQVPTTFPGFEYTYWAEVKQAEVHRRQQNPDEALSIFRRLQKDSKYADNRDRLTYEVARTLEMKGQTEQAEQYYRELLYGEQQNASRSLQAKLHYRLGQIYSSENRNFTAAAAHFDTSSTLQQQDEAAVDRQAGDLADDFGRYANLRESVQRIDSLLWLGSLSQEKLDSVIQDIRLDRRQEIRANQRVAKQNKSLINRPEPEAERNVDTTRAGVYGFLNHRSQNLVSRARSEFAAVWGDRPLVDNWRRREAVQQTSGRGNDPKTGAVNEPAKQDSAAAGLDLEAIPKTGEERDRLEKNRTELLYQLGNVLFLELNRADSAKAYFHKVIENGSRTDLHPKAMYALYEVFQSQNKADSSRYWALRISRRFPGTPYARLVSGDNQKAAMEADRSSKLLEQYQAFRSPSDSTTAEKLRRLALQNRSSGLAPAIHFEAIKAYIDRAKNRESLHIPADSLQDSYKDSVQSDTSGSFRSSRWDSVRLVLAEHDSLFSNSPFGKDVQLLQEELSKAGSSPESMPTCRQYDISLTVEPSLKAFLKTVELPESMQNKSISGTIAYDFIISREGELLSYRPVSAGVLPGIQQALEQAFDRSLAFEPLSPDIDAPKLRCRLAFPVDEIGKN